MSDLSSTIQLSNDVLIDNNVRFSSNKFSFIDTLRILANNKSFTDGYTQNCDDNFELTSMNQNSYIWYALSAVGENIGDLIYNNVANYIDLASNINLCKIKALRSMISMMGINYTVFDSVAFLPDEILQLIDVLSINKRYLFDESVLNNKLINDLKENVLKPIDINEQIKTESLSDIQDIDDLKIYDENKFRNYLTELFYTVLTAKVYATYNDSSATNELTNKYIICANLSTQLLDPTVTRYNEQDTIYNDEFRKFKLLYNIDLTFNEKTIVDRINKGLDFIKNYDGAELSLLNMEISARSAAFDIANPTTRYKYYQEQSVREYFSFIENKIFSDNEIFNDTKYILNPNLIELSAHNKKYLMTYDRENKTLSINNEMIRTVARSLTTITTVIRDLREKLKSQAQKNYIKGTFNLLSYVINEYLTTLGLSEFLSAEFKEHYSLCADSGESYSTISAAVNKNISSFLDKLSRHSVEDVNIIEYYDKTEYFNLETKYSKYALNKEYVNPKFWEEILHIYDDNFENTAKYALAFNQIENYYLNILATKNCMSSTEEFVDFLSTVYSIGNNDIYVDAATKRPVYSTTKEYEDIFINYSGTEYGKYPFFNHKNITHPSYQVHPYLYNLVEVSKYAYPIRNIFGNDTINEATNKLTLENLSSYIGNFGETINFAVHNSYDYSGYKSGYEATIHTKNIKTSTATNEVDGYDGAFYPPALDMFLNNPVECINAVNTKGIDNLGNDLPMKEFFDRFYAPLNLTDAHYQLIANQLSTYKDLIFSIVNNNAPLGVDIYKYTKDYLGNAYILYKEYNYGNYTKSLAVDNVITGFNTHDATGLSSDNRDLYYNQLRNTTGEIWIRLKNHPIAFPAFTGKYPIIDVNNPEFNGRFANIAYGEDNINEGKEVWQIVQDDKLRMQYFYDIDFDSTRKTLFLTTCPLVEVLSPVQNKFTDNEISAVRNNFAKYQTFEKASIIITDIESEYDTTKGYDILKMSSAKTLGSKDIFTDSINHPELTQYFYKGFYVNSMIITFLYVKLVDNNNQNLVECITYTIKPDKTYVITYPVMDMTEILKSGNFTFTTIIDDNNEVVDMYNNFKFSTYQNNITFLLNLTPSLSIDSNTKFWNFNNNITKYYDNTIFEQSEKDGVQEYNSFTKYNTFLVFATSTIDNNLVYDFKTIKYYNLHADPSYIPNYPKIFDNDPELSSNLLDLTKIPLYKNDELYNIELLGSSQNHISNYINYINTLYNITETDVSNIKTSFEADLEEFKKLIYGRVYEDFSDYQLERLYASYNSPLINILLNKENASIFNDAALSCYYIEDTDKPQFVWEIPILDFYKDVLDLSDDEHINNKIKALSNDIEILFTNNHTYGKNSYYHGTLGNSFKQSNLIYTEEFNPTVNNAEIITNYDTILSIGIIGTYNYFNNKVSKHDSNYIYGISSINISCNLPTNKQSLESISKLTLSVNFMIDTTISNRNSIYIDKNDLTFIVYNKHDLRIYEAYSLIDPKPQISVINGIPVALGSDGNFISASDIDLYNYSNLDEIPFLSGVDNPVDFKYQENVIFDVTDSRYFRPGSNDKFPVTPVHLLHLVSNSDCIELFGLIGDPDKNNANIFQNLFNNNNLFANKLNYINIKTDIGNMELSVNSTNEYNDAIRVTEEYAQDSHLYASDDPRIANYFIMDESILHNTELLRNNLNEIELQLSDYIDYILNNDMVGFVNNKLSSAIYGRGTENNIIGEVYYMNYDFDNLNLSADQINDISKFANIYVNYTYNNGDITLYFNYYNYLNSPYLSYINGKFSIDIIPGTYLKLKPGENGLLNIVYQVKFYDAFGNIHACQNITVATYKIYNISDDKPKYVIYKYYNFIRNSIQYLNTTGSTCTIHVNTTKLDNIHEEGQQVTVDIDIKANKPLNKLDFIVDYSKYLTYQQSLTDINPDNYLSVTQYHGRMIHVVNADNYELIYAKLKLVFTLTKPIEDPIEYLTVTVVDPIGTSPTIINGETIYEQTEFTVENTNIEILNL